MVDFTASSGDLKVTHAVLYDTAPNSDFTPLGFTFNEAGEVTEMVKLAKNPQREDDDDDE